MSTPIRVTVWNEFRHEKNKEKVREIYPLGIHEVIASHLRRHPEFIVRTATLDEPEHGLTQEVVDETDVLFWWGHGHHRDVDDRVVDRLQEAVLNGMGLVALHSAHYSKIFKRLMGTTCSLKWREAGENERIWIVEPGHPIAEGLPECIEIEAEEMYGERFDIPEPDTLVFISWFKGGEVFRSGCCYYRGKGKIFYFRPGHETYPTYHHPDVARVLVNAARWAARSQGSPITWGRVEPKEAL